MAGKERRELLAECEMAPATPLEYPAGLPDAERDAPRATPRSDFRGSTRDVDQASFSVSDSSPALRITTLNFRPFFFWFAKNLATCLPTAGTLNSPVG